MEFNFFNTFLTLSSSYLLVTWYHSKDKVEPKPVELPPVPDSITKNKSVKTLEEFKQIVLPRIDR